jgi:hypothetical protein
LRVKGLKAGPFPPSILLREELTMNKLLNLALLSTASVLIASSVYAQDAQEKRYAPAPEYAEDVYFGDTHNGFPGAGLLLRARAGNSHATLDSL